MHETYLLASAQMHGGEMPDFFWVIMGVLFLAVIAVSLFTAPYKEDRYIYVLLNLVRKPRAAVIGYKVADFAGPHHNLPFRGVAGRFYGVEDESQKSSPGFHMYDTLQDAFDHPQRGPVCLEVLGYGKVKKYDLGHITSRQRVLQVIIDRCESYGKTNSERCKHLAAGWREDQRAWECGRHGKILQFEEMEEILERNSGHRVAVRSRNGIDTTTLFQRMRGAKTIPPFTPIHELVDTKDTQK